MQNWKSVLTLSSAASSGNRLVSRQLSLQQRALSTSLIPSGSGKKRITGKLNGNSRNQSTTQSKLAASHVQSVLRKEVVGSLEEEDDENDFESKQQQHYVKDSDNQNEAQSLFDLAMKQVAKTESHKFVHRHIGPREEDIVEMLNVLGYKTLDELIADTIPEQIKLDRSLDLPEALTEHELVERLRQIGSMNEATEWKSYIGMGYYDCVTPTPILRNMFENPGWTTAYTAYQAEIAQGRLESLMNYQTMISDLTGLDVANASLLDESTAAAEAMQVCLRYHKSKRNKFLVSTRCHPQTRAVVETRAKALGIQVDYFDELASAKQINQPATGERVLNQTGKKLKEYKLNDYSGVLIQYPNTDGHLFDMNEITKSCHEDDCLVVAATDLMACTLFKPPGDFEHPADIAIGSSQRFGIPLNYGGPHAAFMACKQKLVRLIPGRVVGLTRDSQGNQAYRFALQTREQHIRRDKATSNICTAQALLANMSAMYAVYHGPEGLKKIASTIHGKTSLLAHLIKQSESSDGNNQVSIVNDGSYFDTLTLRVSNLDGLKRRAEVAKINLRYIEDEGLVSISLDEATKLADIFRLVNLFNESNGTKGSQQQQNYKQLLTENLNLLNNLIPPVDGQLKPLKRTTAYLTHPVFNTHRSEAQLVRYMKSLENKDISLAHSMIPLGSCTMKLNSTTQMLASSWPEFSNCHPFQPTDQCKGYMKLFEELDSYLCEVTGYDKVSLQPNSGAQGEYAGLRVIKAYLESRGEYKRNICLIPVSAHGTNPASAQMAGFTIKTIKVRENGNIDVEDLVKNIEKHRDELACLMITYPSTYGVFEESVRQVCDMIHEAGGQVYLDGANMNAQVGLCRPGDYGSDVSHLNLHKTFCIPHGGGGPGAGPIGVKKHLIPFLPSHPLVDDYSLTVKESFGTISASMWGSPAILPISWSYIRLMAQDLKLSSQIAILNANYMRKKLENDYKILFRGEKGNVAHEFILDCRPFKKTANIEAVDIAKRLQDFGFHAPTVSWPVTNTLMLEPTESEDKEQLDRYCEALLIIRKEIADIENGKMDRNENPLKNAPHTQQVVCSSSWNKSYTREQAAFPAKFVTPITKLWPTVGRVDDTYGDTNLFCSCPPAI